MPRHTIYMSEPSEAQIKGYIQLMRNEGVVGTEVTISGFGGKLLELGLRVYKNQQDKVENPIDELNVERLILQEAILTRHLMQANLRTMFKLPEVGSDSTFNYTDLVKSIHVNAAKEVDKIYGVEE
jgi:hypothetical protein